MNCANHADAPPVAYCRTCGKPLCANCTRPVRGVIYCEDCLGAKMEGIPAATAGFVSGSFSPAAPSPAASGQVPPPPPPGVGSGPNPAVAGILAGFFPFGVGAVYTGQYAKGLAHLGIFGLLIAGISACDSGRSEVLGPVCGIALAFFYIYQIIDTVRSAHAIQAGQPAPDPFGLSATFGGGAKIEASNIPMGAIVLIALGALFLLHTMGLIEYGLDRFWPLILIVLGFWLFARNWGLLGPCRSGCGCARCRTRRLMGPAMLLTIGGLFLLENWHVVDIDRTWPVILLVIGGVKLLQSAASAEGHIPRLRLNRNVGGGPIPPTPPTPPSPPVPPTSSEVNTNEVNRG